MITVAGIIVKSALARKGSVGAHYRSDFKARGENWKQHISWNKRDFAPPKNTPENIRKTKKKACNL
jgi:succinate dehydrogenase/fumarate reductase flavoprotein subunit